MPLSAFHPVIQRWFRSRFDAPTEAQAAGWPAIAQGRHTLIAAPTGSGKTLTAFLTCIDQLVRQGMDTGLSDATQVVYVSPLKALSNDIQKNLANPLEEIAALAEETGTPIPQITTAVRTGDTPASERQKLAKRPPHILITTPESLYILLTSDSGRRGLKHVRTLILDEIHAVADDKRGAHLALSVERLCQLSEEPITRIGLSATQRPLSEMARFLVGNRHIDADGNPDCVVVDTGSRRKIDLSVELPEQELGPIATHEIWGETLDAIAGLTQTHAITLVFVNTRRLVERVAHQLSSRLGEEAVVAHHGSLSRATRWDAEQKLKNGQVKVCVATASLELGIDIGEIDLVCQIGSPRSIGLLVQRVGRSGHTVGGVPKGKMFPLTRDEMLECAALSRALLCGNLDTFVIPSWPLDVMAQQMVAASSCEDWDEDALFELCRRAYPYRNLPRDRFGQVVESLSQGFAPRQGRNGAHLHRDGINHRVKGRRGARLAALTSGGAIPDNADYDVVADPEGTFVGTINEDFAIESMAGDIFLLGNTPWKVRRVESGRVRVEDAQGNLPTIPFWLGEAPGRTRELSDEITQLRDGIDRLLDNPQNAAAWVISEAGVSPEVARQLVAYLIEGKRVLGVVPTANRVVAERFFDESGGMQLVIHAPFGAAINRAWGMALRKRICRTFDFELQATATDDGLNFSLGPSMAFPLGDVFNYLSPNTVEEVLTQAVFQAPLFGTRWRWNASRFLALLRHSGGKKVPAPLQRMRSDDLLAAVFPAQVQCQDNAAPGDIDPPDHPLVFETTRDCLTEAMSLEGLKSVLESIRSGNIEVLARDTVQPSVFAHQILNAMPYAFLDDAPLEERRARAVSLRRALPEDSRDLSALDPDAIKVEAAYAWPAIRDADELHDALLTLGVAPPDELASRTEAVSRETLMGWLEDLDRAGRALRMIRSEGATLWLAAEHAALVSAAYPDAALEGRASLLPPAGGTDGDGLDREDAVLHLVRGWAECSGPFTASEMAGMLGLSRSDVDTATAALENEGLILRGSFRSGVDEEEFCDRRILARIHRATVGRLRREIEPVPQSSFMRFLFRWQHAATGWQTTGEGGLLDVIDKLQGFETAAAAWEPELLARRVTDYRPELLDRLCTGGEVVWGRLSRGNNATSGISSGPRAAPLTRTSSIAISLRESLDWLLDPAPESVDSLRGAMAEITEILSIRGACFQSDLIAHTRRLPSDVEEALWALAANGLVTSDSVIPLRARIDGKQVRGKKHRGRADGKRSRRNGSRESGSLSARTGDSQPLASQRSRSQRQVSAGRWSLLESLDPVEDPLEYKAMQLLHRYGVVFPELMAREKMAPRWRDLVRIYRRLEARGEIRGGRFVSGFVGEQFALPDAVTALREAHRAPATGALEAVSACDPLNLVGIVTPGERVPSQPGNRVVFRDGVPVASLEKGVVVNRSNADSDAMTAAVDLLYGPIRPPQPEQRRPFDAYQGSIQQAWPLPDHAVLEPAPATRFNLN
ncbi:MAG: DEAD/DEAH box helicase [Dehalococcoidia bacterium]|nr:DEAD/DEAH box helicase [Dehalococcoidia bacterium]